ncbi:MAG: AIR synthase-related protein [Candidatus Helarchaeota archaeon]
MADLEGLARILLEKGTTQDEIIKILKNEYLFYKSISEGRAISLASAILEEVNNSLITPDDAFTQEILRINEARVTMGEQGVGCRGYGDFFVHKLIAELCETSTVPFLSPKALDDCGAVEYNGGKTYIVSKMEGMHSRLSEFPFLAGFHVTRAALRDLYVKGAKPISIVVDIHLADDADIGKLFDFMSGVVAVAELTNTPITAGSTLRIGGDMVIGTRLSGGIGAIGTAPKILARRHIEIGDDILLTEGAGGGTIVTAALFGGKPEILLETLNVQFLRAAEKLMSENIINEIHAMCDVTNGGMRGDLHEIAYEADNAGMEINEEKIQEVINSKVLALLKERNIDYLGVSLDSLLIFTPPDATDKILHACSEVNVKITKIGEVKEKNYGIKLISKGGDVKLIPKFRESAYTKIKKIIGEDLSEDKKRAFEKRILESQKLANKKKQIVLNWIRNKWGR